VELGEGLGSSRARTIGQAPRDATHQLNLELQDPRRHQHPKTARGEGAYLSMRKHRHGSVCIAARLCMRVHRQRAGLIWPVALVTALHSPPLPLQVQRMMGGAYEYRNGLHALQTLLRHEGLRGLFQVSPIAPNRAPELGLGRKLYAPEPCGELICATIVVEGNRRASRNGRVSALPPAIPTSRFATFASLYAQGYWITNSVWIPWNMMYVAGYEQLKRHAAAALECESPAQLPQFAFAACAAAAAAAAAVVTHPVDVVKTRFQVRPGRERERETGGGDLAEAHSRIVPLRRSFWAPHLVNASQCQARACVDTWTEPVCRSITPPASPTTGSKCFRIWAQSFPAPLKASSQRDDSAVSFCLGTLMGEEEIR
jgi:hypothetical protein